jgi:hypothetical protein
MEAKRFLERLEGTSFDPEALKAIGRAFDEAWSDIAGNFGDAAQIEAVRSKLARPSSPPPATAAATLQR